MRRVLVLRSERRIAWTPAASGEAAWRPYGGKGSLMAFRAEPQAFSGLFPGMYALNEAAVCRKRAANLPWIWNVGLASPPLPPAPSCP